MRRRRWHGQRVGAAREARVEALRWAEAIITKSPTFSGCSIRFNLIDDGLVGQQVFAGEAARLREQRGARRTTPSGEAHQDFSKFPWQY